MAQSSQRRRSTESYGHSSMNVDVAVPSGKHKTGINQRICEHRFHEVNIRGEVLLKLF